MSNTKFMMGIGSGMAFVGGSWWMYNRLGYNGEKIVNFCPHEEPWVETGFLYDTCYSKPVDCFLTVWERSVRPFKIIKTEENCEISLIDGDCLGELRDEFLGDIDEKTKSDDTPSDVGFVLTSKGIQFGMPLPLPKKD